LAKGKNNQIMQVNGLNPFKPADTTKKRVFWVGESTKNNKRVERRQLSSALSQISNSVSDMAINNCNRLFWLKHGSVETIRLWELGKQLGATGGVEGNIIVNLEVLEKRDRNKKSQREEGENKGYK